MSVSRDLTNLKPSLSTRRLLPTALHRLNLLQAVGPIRGVCTGGVNAEHHDLLLILAQHLFVNEIEGSQN